MICKCCGAEAPTKYIEFYQNIGALFIRHHKRMKGNLCKDCINEYFWRFTLISLTLGWWGFTSFFLTPFLILNNLIRYLGTLGLRGVPKNKLIPTKKRSSSHYFGASQAARKPQKYYRNSAPSKTYVRERDRIWYDTRDSRPELQQETPPANDSSINDLIKYLGCSNNSNFRSLAAKLLGQKGSTAIPAISALLLSCVDIDATVRNDAFSALESIDPDWCQSPEVQKALPKLAQAFKHSYCFKSSYSEEVSQTAYKLLRQIGKPAVPFLAHLIVEEEDKIEYKIRAIWILRDLGSEATSAVPQLIRSLKDKGSRVRIAAAEALVGFGPVAEAATPELIAGLADRNADVRKAMVTCLVATQPAVPDLIPLLADKNPNVRKGIVDALFQIGPQTIPTLIETIFQECTGSKDNTGFEDHQKITGASLQVLGKFGAEAAAAMPTMALALADSHVSIKFAAVQALHKISHNWMSEPGVIQTITNLAGNPAGNSHTAKTSEELVGEVVLTTFTAIGGAAVPILIDALEFGDRVTRRNAARALAEMGAEAKIAIPALTRALKDDDRQIQHAAAKALQNLGSPAS